MTERTYGNEDEGRAMEGRQVSKDGADLGDADFHEAGFGLSEAKEKQTLEELSRRVVDLEERQVKNLAKNDPYMGIKGFRQLLERHPNDKRADEWRIALKQLEGGMKE